NFWAAAGALGQAQPERFIEMRDLIAPTDTPTLYFLHLVLPHIPWRFYEDGTPYSVPSDDAGIDADSSHQWLVELNETRLRQQARHTDGLLGQLLARFDEAGIYDDAVVVVAGDHGVNVALDAGARDFGVGAASDVMYTPLFIKEPAQTEGRVDETNTTALDVFPTVAAAAGLRIPWSVDGLDLAAGITDERGDTKTIYRFDGPLSAGEPGVFDYQQPMLDAELVRPGLPDALTDEGDIRPLYNQLGPAADLLDTTISGAEAATGASAVVPARQRVEQPPADDSPIGIVTGTIAGEVPPDDTVVAIAVDDRVVALSPIVPFQGEAQSFVAFLPPGIVEAGGSHRLDVGWWSPDLGLQRLDLR
ncbi:MAG: sulfatase-like hydrolase/transferase, partial [Acidimicrobiales bacterium]